MTEDEIIIALTEAIEDLTESVVALGDLMKEALAANDENKS